jgi:hypothetical protein
VRANVRSLAKVEQVDTAPPTISLDGTNVVPELIDIDGLSLTPTKTGLLLALYVNLSYFTLATWPNGRLFDEL